MTTRSLIVGLALAGAVATQAGAVPLRDGAALGEGVPAAPLVEVKKGGWKHGGHPGRHLGWYGNPGKRKGWYKKGGPRFF